MPIELQTTLEWVGIITALFMAVVALAGAPVALVPFFFGGIGGAVGAFIGQVLGSPDLGAFIGGVVGFLGFVAWFIYTEDQKDKRRYIQQQQQQPSSTTIIKGHARGTNPKS